MEEYDNSPRAMEGIGTSTAGFIGLAVKGPTAGAPSLITNFAEFIRQFGGFLSEYTHGEYRYLAYSVEQFFTNGGTRCFLSRVIPGDAKTATAKQGVLSFKAANEGKWGNRITVTVTASSKKKIQLVEKLGEKLYRAKSLSGFREGDIVKAGEELNRILAIYEENITFEKEFSSDPVDSQIVAKNLLLSAELDLTVRYNDEVEAYQGLTFNQTSPNYIVKRLESSDLIKAEAEAVEGLINPATAVFGENVTSGIISFSEGSDGTVDNISAGTFIGEDNGPGKRTGIQAFLENSAASIIAVPGVVIPEVIAALIAHCENLGNRFAVIDMPRDLTKTKDLIDFRSFIDSTYAAVYHPWIQVYDRATQKSGFIPPSGAILGVYSRTDISRGVHKAPANETVACTGLSINFTKGEQDILNPEGINLIRAIPGQGIRVWGARTASSNSSFKYVNVRRLFIFVEESIKANTSWVVFEPNNANLWARVRMTIASFLDSLWRAGMLSGGSPTEAYFVDIGPSTMSTDDIANGRLICNIGIAPSKPAEFVILRVTQHTNEAGAGEA